MPKHLTPALVLLLAVAPLACQREPKPPASTDKPGDKPNQMVAAILLSEPPTDRGWAQQGYESTMAIESRLGARVLSAVTKGNPADDLAEFAANGATMVIAHGGEFSNEIRQVAAKYPRTVFINSGGEQALGKNTRAIAYRLEEASYLAGIVAAHMTKSKRVAAVGGMDFPSVKRVMQGFRQGVASIDDTITVDIVYINTWTDVVKAKSQTLSLLASGADVVFQNTNAASQGIFEACKEKGAFAFGCNADQNNDTRFSDIILGSAVINMPKIFTDIAQQVQSGEFAGDDVLQATTRLNMVAFIPNPRTIDLVPQGATSRRVEVEQQIRDGTLVVAP